MVETQVKDYLKLEKIGEGAYGAVYKAKNVNTNEIVAIKKVKIDMEEDGVPATAIREVSIVQELTHPNITPIIDLFVNSVPKTRDVSLYIIFPYLDYDLYKF